MTDPTWLSGVSPRKYVGTFLTNLDDPHEIWRHAFEHQLSEGAKVLLCLMATLPPDSFLDDVRDGFKLLYRTYSETYHVDTRPNDLRCVLKELDGNFVQFDREDGRTTVTFHNPSVRDFIQNYLLQNEEEVLLLLRGAKFFEQLVWLWNFEREGSHRFTFRAMLRRHSNTFVSALERTLDLPSYRQRYRWVEGEFRHDRISIEERVEFLATVDRTLKHSGLTSQVVSKLDRIKRRVQRGHVNRKDLARLLEGLVNLSWFPAKELNELVRVAQPLFVRVSDEIGEFEAYRMFSRSFPTAIDDTARMHIAEKFSELADQKIYKFDADSVREYASQLKDLGSEFAVDVSQAITKLEADARRKEKEARRRYRTRRAAKRSRLNQNTCTDEDLASMFAAFA